jgi:hypothetical protein
MVIALLTATAAGGVQQSGAHSVVADNLGDE